MEAKFITMGPAERCIVIFSATLHHHLSSMTKAAARVACGWEGVQHTTVRLQNFFKLNRDVCISSVVHWNKKKACEGVYLWCAVLLRCCCPAKFEFFILFFFHNKNDGVGMTLNLTFFFFVGTKNIERKSEKGKLQIFLGGNERVERMTGMTFIRIFFSLA